MSVAEVAEDLALSPVVVRQHLTEGVLSGRRIGREWLVDVRSVNALKQNRPQPGRPMSPAVAWSVLLTASGDREGAKAAVGGERSFYRALRWLREHSLADDRSGLRRRAEVERFDAHPAEVRRLARSSDLLRSGLAAGASVGLVGGGKDLDAYAPASRREPLIDKHALEPSNGPVLVRWVPDHLWLLLDRDGDGVAPRAAVLLDLLEGDEPRARREARRALDGLVGAK